MRKVLFVNLEYSLNLGSVSFSVSEMSLQIF